MTDVRSTSVTARSTEVFGRVLMSARNHHVVVDGPVQNGCPGEALTPPELFLGGVATCGVELVGVIAKTQGLDIGDVHVRIEGTIDRTKPVREDVTVFTTVRLHFDVHGVGDENAAALVEAFKAR